MNAAAPVPTWPVIVTARACAEPLPVGDKHVSAEDVDQETVVQIVTPIEIVGVRSAWPKLSPLMTTSAPAVHVRLCAQPLAVASTGA